VPPIKVLRIVLFHEKNTFSKKMKRKIEISDAIAKLFPIFVDCMTSSALHARTKRDYKPHSPWMVNTITSDLKLIF
jgi:thymidine kinase